MNHGCLQRPDGVPRSPRGERSPESVCGFQNWNDRIHVGCTGCATQPFHPCDLLRRSREIHVQSRVAHVQHAGDSYTGSADTLVLLDKVPDELPEPQGHSHFAGRAQYQVPDPHRGP